MTKTRVLLVDDHTVLRDGLRAIIQSEATLEIVGEAEDGLRAVQLASSLAPDIVIMDIGMGRMNGMEATREITSRNPAIQIVALSCYTDKRYVQNMLSAGARAYVIKASASTELLKAIGAVARGDSYLSPQITRTVVQDYVKRWLLPGEGAYTELGPREREVLQLLAEGKTSQEIGGLLHISPRTVETHRRNIMRKLELHTIAELTKYAIREGLTSVEA